MNPGRYREKKQRVGPAVPQPSLAHLNFVLRMTESAVTSQQRLKLQQPPHTLNVNQKNIT